MKTAWRQPLATPRPMMAGVHGAIVLGASGEEIHADKLGRVKVQLFYDHRAETSSEKACCLAPLGQAPVAPPAHVAATAVAGAVALASVQGFPERHAERLRRFLASGRDIGHGGGGNLPTEAAV